MSSTTSLAIPNLQARIAGRVITPESDDYDAARRVFYGGIDARPAAIVRADHDEDVCEVVAIAAETGAELAVRSGGHNGAGLSTSDGGIVLDLRDMDAMEIFRDRTAVVEAGMTARGFTEAAAERGLALGFGDTGSVGISGITLGGGIGFLVRAHGMTIDDLLSVDLVTADADWVRVDEESHPDLFWALRGGGGNFGVATRFRFRLHPLETVFGGMLFLPATPEVIEGFMAEAARAPDELSTIASAMVGPPMPFLPDEVQGRPLVIAMMLYAGDPAAGERAVAPFRALAEPLADMLRPMRYPEMYQPEPEDFHPLAASFTGFADAVGPAESRAIVERLDVPAGMMRVVQLRQLGGAMARVPGDATAFAHRTRNVMVNVASLYEEGDDPAPSQAWVDDTSALIRQGEPAAYVNFLTQDAERRIREAYPGPTWERLREVKARYDPTNLFRRNVNIPPAGS